MAILADIHGNLQALEAVLEHVAGQEVDQIIVAGDVVNVFPEAKACWDLVMSLDCPVLLGNHEVYVSHYGTPEAEPVWASERFKLLEWMQAQFSPQDLEAMRHLPLTYQLPGLLITHAAPRDPFASIHDTTPLDKVQAMFEGYTEALIVRGHNHRWRETELPGQTVVTIGSVGMPLEGRREAQYALLSNDSGTWTYRPQAVSYDVEALIEQVDSDSYRAIAGPIGQIFVRELETARPHILAFFERYLEAIEREDITLEAAVTAYLA